MKKITRHTYLILLIFKTQQWWDIQLVTWALLTREEAVGALECRMSSSVPRALHVLPLALLGLGFSLDLWGAFGADFCPGPSVGVAWPSSSAIRSRCIFKAGVSFAPCRGWRSSPQSVVWWIAWRLSRVETWERRPSQAHPFTWTASRRVRLILWRHCWR